MIRKATAVLAPILMLVACGDQTTPTEPMLDVSAELSKTAVGGRGVKGALGVVYVRSQGLYYDTFVSASTLPPRGPFQHLDTEEGATDYGPGDPGYVGGRWWIDANGDGMQNEGDVFLLCPLLPPGRTSP
jgi:hypothetical protein